MQVLFRESFWIEIKAGEIAGENGGFSRFSTDRLVYGSDTESWEGATAFR